MKSAKKLNWIVLKISNKCNLNCKYCYVFNRGDKSHLKQPDFISSKTCQLIAIQINSYCKQHKIPKFYIELHGGEPLSIGKKNFGNLISTFRSICTEVDIDFFMQTNGLLLDCEWLQLFSNYGISFGISIDGPPSVADKYRVYHNGKGTTDDLLKKINKLNSSSTLFAKLNTGALAVIHPEFPGSKLVRWFVKNKFRMVDFLLPDVSYNNIPLEWCGSEQYKHFLIDAFDQWYYFSGNEIKIRFFNEILRKFLGASSSLDVLGGDPAGLCVVEADGSVRPNDVMRICSENFTSGLMNLSDSALDNIYSYYNYDGFNDYCNECKSCYFFSICRSGYLPHRYDGKSFKNKSIYCDALYALFEHIYVNLRRDIPTKFWKRKE